MTNVLSSSIEQMSRFYAIPLLHSSIHVYIATCLVTTHRVRLDWIGLLLLIYILYRMPSSGMRRRMAIVRTDDSEERIACIIRVKRISEVVTTLAVPSNNNCYLVKSLLILFALMIEAIWSSERSILTRAAWHHIPEDDILHSHRA
jgi:hypothetical protein